jgi:hypothetical protein
MVVPIGLAAELQGRHRPRLKQLSLQREQQAVVG